MLTVYAQYEKQKSRRVLHAFADGHIAIEGGAMSSWTSEKKLFPGDAVFYGVRPPWVHLWNQAKAENRKWYYVDNAFFDCAREKYFRIGVNAVQSWSRKKSDGIRLARLFTQIKPWAKSGRNVLICPQTDEFMRTVAGDPDWLKDTKELVSQYTDRPVVVRNKQTQRSIQKDLQDAWIVVVHSSCAAVEALCAGVPIIVTDGFAATASFSSSFNDIENPRRPDGRLEFMSRLADSQWTLEQLRDGTAWRAINHGTFS